MQPDVCDVTSCLVERYAALCTWPQLDQSRVECCSVRLDPRLSNTRIVWLNLAGSGNETAAHVQASGRITLMFCAFAGDPLILRVYGQGRVIHPRDVDWNELVELFPAPPGARQIIDVGIELVQTSCGFGVPLLDFISERGLLRTWAEKKGADGVEQYWQDKNQVSLDGKPTGIL